MCESKEKTLCIHHTYYNHKIDPWDYPNHCLITLCWPCHEREREAEVDAFENLKIILKESGFISTDIWSLFEDLGCILTFKNKKYLSKSIRKIVYQIHKDHK